MELGLTDLEIVCEDKRSSRMAFRQVLTETKVSILRERIRTKQIDTPVLEKYIEQLNALKLQGKAKVYMHPYFVTFTSFLTDGCHQEEMNYFHACVISLSKLCWVKQLDFSYELTEAGHIHVHILLQVSQPKCKSQVIDLLRRSKLSSCADFKVKGNKFLHVDYRPKEIDIQNTMSYITKNNDKDIEFRKKYFLSNLYTICQSGEQDEWSAESDEVNLFADLEE